MLDDTAGLVGIVTIDDVVDVIREENTEDVLKMAGTGDVDIASKSVFRNTRARLPWLLASFIGGLIAVYMIGQFQEPLEKITALAFFIPIIMGMGGNIGTQSSTIIVRGLATGEVDLKEAWKVLWREFATGTTLGAAYGVLIGVFVLIATHFANWNVPDEVAPKYVWFPVVVSLAICVNMIIAATIGTIIPILFKRFRIDPAIATGPFVTIAIDVFGLLFYFIIAGIFLF